MQELTLEQKVRLLTGADFWSLHDEPAIGLRSIVVSDGPAGVRGRVWDEREPSANVPSPTALAATWDAARVERMGRLLAFEARRKGVDVLLAPTVNLHRSPLGGRVFECFSEDPYLTGAIGAAYVRGLQEEGVGATVKHFVANDSETERFTLDARVSERALRELYLLPFELIAAETPWAVMAAYNRVNGVTMTESPLLQSVLHDEWGWDGLVMSDWMATRGTAGAGNAAMDLAMPGPSAVWGDALVAAVRAGEVSEAAVDAKMQRLLRLAQRVGALGAGDEDGGAGRAAGAAGAGAAGVGAAGAGAAGAGASGAGASGAGASGAGAAGAGASGAAGPGAPGATVAAGAAAPRDATPWSDEDVAAELRSTAAASFVLARNHGSLLPLEAGSLRTVAVIGPNAAMARTLGGGSATVFPRYTVSPVEGIRAAVRGEITHAPGVRTTTRLPIADITSADVRYLDADGTVILAENREIGELTWLGTLDPRVEAIELRTTLRAERAGEHLVGPSGAGHYQLSLRGELVFDGELSLPEGADVAEALFAPPQHGVPVTLAAGETLDVVLRRIGVAPLTTLALAFQPPFDDEDAELERAVALARDADVAIVVVGTTAEVESEGFDRTSLALPGRQDELVRRVNAAQPRTIVVVNAGAPVLMPWLDEVPGVLLCWFPGQEAGNALADVIFGAAEPGGRLPTTWPASDDGLPSVTPVAGVVEYTEELAIGYRGPVTPLLPFGHGLGYTTWEYLAMDGATVRLCNTGTRRGREVIQVYASRPDSSVERPPRWLVGFEVIEADAGEEIVLDIPLSPRAFQHWDGGWQTEPGEFVLEAGRSVADLRVSSTWS
ncbi:beta-glucosidase [Solirubrobacter soli]|uniref:beta-glucosidase n=1 Tax=Solirubrobacter soli TaxID=363832 RepID=UPI0003F6596B|nr:glycoside hydrolase family 3 C-terminal domain-containing protein [Solirubrobacter soli]